MNYKITIIIEAPSEHRADEIKQELREYLNENLDPTGEGMEDLIAAICEPE